MRRKPILSHQKVPLQVLKQSQIVLRTGKEMPVAVHSHRYGCMPEQGLYLLWIPTLFNEQNHLSMS